MYGYMGISMCLRLVTRWQDQIRICCLLINPSRVWQKFRYLGTPAKNQTALTKKSGADKFKECLLTFSSVSFVFSSPVQKFKD